MDVFPLAGDRCPLNVLLKLFGCLGANGDDRIGGKASPDLRRQNVNGDAMLMLLSDIRTDGGKISTMPYARKDKLGGEAVATSLLFVV